MAPQSVKLTLDFKQRVARLVERKKGAEQSFKHAIGAYLDFCREYFNLHNAAKTRTEKAYLYEQTGLDEPTLRSTYQRIGENFGVLKKHIALLPPSQESLKQLARAEKRREGTIDRLVKKGTLTPQTSVSEVRIEIQKMLDPKRRQKHSTLPERPATTGQQHIITLTSSNRGELIEHVVALLKQSESITATVMGRKPLRDDVKSALGSWWKDHEARLAFVE